MLLLYNFYSLHCPLSGPDLIYISLLIIPCIIYYVTNKETLNLVKVTLDEIVKRSMYQKFDVGHLFNPFEKSLMFTKAAIIESVQQNRPKSLS